MDDPGKSGHCHWGRHHVRVCSVHPPSGFLSLAKNVKTFCDCIYIDTHISRSKPPYRLPFRFWLPSELEPATDLRASAAAPWPPEANRTALRTLTTSPAPPPPPPPLPPPAPSRFAFFNDEPPGAPFPICLMRAIFVLLSASTDFSIGSNWGTKQRRAEVKAVSTRVKEEKGGREYGTLRFTPRSFFSPSSARSNLPMLAVL